MEYKYDVALSFAGEDREYVERFAKILEAKGIKVFYDKFEEADLWGKDLGIHFDFVYRKSAKYCIPFFSKFYKEKIWTNYELRNFISRAIENNEEYILPVRFDDSEIDGIRSTLGFVDARKKTPKELAELFERKLKKEEKPLITQEFQEKHGDIVYLGIYNSFYSGSFGVESGESSFQVTITNKINAGYRYFYEPTFRMTEPFGGSNAFQLLNPNSKYRFPIKMEYGQEISVPYPLNPKQIQIWEKLKPETQVYAICSTTVGEKYESNRVTVDQIIKAIV